MQVKFMTTEQGWQSGLEMERSPEVDLRLINMSTL